MERRKSMIADPISSSIPHNFAQRKSIVTFDQANPQIIRPKLRRNMTDFPRIPPLTEEKKENLDQLFNNLNMEKPRVYNRRMSLIPHNDLLKLKKITETVESTDVLIEGIDILNHLTSNENRGDKTNKKRRSSNFYTYDEGDQVGFEPELFSTSKKPAGTGMPMIVNPRDVLGKKFSLTHEQSINEFKEKIKILADITNDENLDDYELEDVFDEHELDFLDELDQLTGIENISSAARDYYRRLSVFETVDGKSTGVNNRRVSIVNPWMRNIPTMPGSVDLETWKNWQSGLNYNARRTTIANFANKKMEEQQMNNLSAKEADELNMQRAILESQLKNHPQFKNLPQTIIDQMVMTSLVRMMTKKKKAKEEGEFGDTSSFESADGKSLDSWSSDEGGGDSWVGSGVLEAQQKNKEGDQTAIFIS